MFLARLTSEFQPADLLHQVVAIVQFRHRIKTFQALQLKRIGIVEVQSAPHVQQVSDGEFLPHRVFLLELRQIVSHHIVHTLDVALVHSNAAHQRRDRLRHREDRAQPVDGDVAHIMLIDDAVVMDDENTLRVCLTLQGLP